MEKGRKIIGKRNQFFSILVAAFLIAVSKCNFSSNNVCCAQTCCIITANLHKMAYLITRKDGVVSRITDVLELRDVPIFPVSAALLYSLTNDVDVGDYSAALSIRCRCVRYKAEQIRICMEYYHQQFVTINSCAYVPLCLLVVRTGIVCAARFAVFQWCAVSMKKNLNKLFRAISS